MGLRVGVFSLGFGAYGLGLRTQGLRFRFNLDLIFTGIVAVVIVAKEPWTLYIPHIVLPKS